MDAAGQRIAVGVNGVRSYLGDDALGSASLALGSDGSVQAATLYAPYGTVRYASGTMPTNRGFTGQPADALTGLDFFGARYYDPVLGQFTSADTLAAQLNRYAYVGGNPSTRVDPDGHCWPLCTIIIGAVVGAVVGGGVSLVSQVAAGKSVDWGEVGKQVAGAISGMAGPEAGILAQAAVGAASGAAQQLATNVVEGKPLGDGVLLAADIGGATGGVGGALGEVGGKLLGRVLGNVAKDAAGGVDAAASEAEGAIAGAACGLSFAPSTPVATPGGARPIAARR